MEAWAAGQPCLGGGQGCVTKPIPPSRVWLQGKMLCLVSCRAAQNLFLSCQRGVGIRVGTSMAALSIGCALALHWGPLVLEKCPVSPVTCRLSNSSPVG